MAILAKENLEKRRLNHLVIHSNCLLFTRRETKPQMQRYPARLSEKGIHSKSHISTF